MLPETERGTYALTNVKEKFGDSVLYDEIYPRDRARDTLGRESIRTCEQCGQPGQRVVQDGLILT